MTLRRATFLSTHRTLVLIGMSSVGLAACASSEPMAPPSGPDGAVSSAVMVDRLFARYDADLDGIISFAEIEAERTANFTQLDIDGDGAIDGSELNRLRRQMNRDRSRRGRRNSDPVGRMDRDRDGRIELNEFDGVQGSLLDRADFDGDGNIDRAEVEDMISRQQSRRRR